MAKPPPKSFGRYDILERIAVGGMAEVFRAKVKGAAGFERIVALKRILPGYSQDREFVAMFIDEAKIASLLSHGNVCQIYDLGEVDNRYFIVMEHVDGKDVRCLLEALSTPKKVGKIPPDLAAYIAAETCAGLDYAHRKTDAQGKAMQIVHRDVSPSNILISYEGEVKIGDFGIAKAKEKLSRTRTGTIKGKYNYLAPEAVRGLGVDHRSDVFGMGAVLYEMLTGRKAFDAPSEIRILELVRAGRYTPIRELEPDIPPAIEKIVDRAMVADPNKRYQSAAEMEYDLHNYLYSLRRRTSGAELAAFIRGVFGKNQDGSAGLGYIPPAPIATPPRAEVPSYSEDRETELPALKTESKASAPFEEEDDPFREEKTSIVNFGIESEEAREDDESNFRDSRTAIFANPLQDDPTTLPPPPKPTNTIEELQSEPTAIRSVPLDDPLWQAPPENVAWGNKQTLEVIAAVILGLLWLGVTVQHSFSHW